MATTLAQQNARANDGTFQAAVAAAFWQLAPDIGRRLEVVGFTINDGNASVALTQGMIDRRRAWAIDFTRQPAHWIPKCAAMLAGEPSIMAIDIATAMVPDDATIFARARRIVHALAGAPTAEP